MHLLINKEIENTFLKNGKIIFQSYKTEQKEN